MPRSRGSKILENIKKLTDIYVNSSKSKKIKDYLENKVKTQHNAQITSSHPTGSGWPVRVQRATDARIDQTQCTRVQARCTRDQLPADMDVKGTLKVYCNFKHAPSSSNTGGCSFVLLVQNKMDTARHSRPFPTSIWECFQWRKVKT